MATSELRLRWLNPLGDARWTYRNLVFDFTMMTDPFVRPWTVQGIETGIQAATGSAAVNKELQSLLAGGRRRTIRFFSDGQSFVSGLKASSRDGRSYGLTGASGVSLCAEGFSAEGNPTYVSTSPEARTDLRMYLNPTGGTGMSLPSPDGSYRPTYSYLMGTLWHEFHHMAALDTEQHGLNTSPPYEPRWQNAMTAIRGGFPAIAWDPVTRAVIPLWTNQWAAVPCMCGRLA